MIRTIAMTCCAFLRRRFHKHVRGIGGAGGGKGGIGGAGGGKGGIRGQSGFLTTLLSVVIFVVFYFNFYSSNSGYIEKVTANATAFAESEQPNVTWMALRKKLLEHNGSSVKVIIFGYMRGGSTLFSEIFNLDPSSDVMWHEPMDAFYQSFAGFEAHSIPLTILYNKNFTRRLLNDFEKDEMTNHLENLLSCRPENLPIETLAHFHLSYSVAFKQLYNCMEERNVKTMVLDCIKPLRPICGYTDLIRRDMSKSLENKCPQLIAGFKSLRHKNDFLAQRLLFETAKSADGVADARADSADRFDDRTTVEIIDRIFPELNGNVSTEMKRNVALLLLHHRCLSRIQPTVSVCALPAAVDVCRRATLVAVKLIRTMFGDLEATIQRIPDIRIIHYVRDPRAIATSRVEKTTRLTMLADNQSAIAESMILCRRMMADVEAKRRLATKYPGSVVTVRYEDFVRNPLRHIRDVFERILGRPVPRDIGAWISSRFRGTQDNGIYGTVRANPVSTSLNWMTETNLMDALQMDRHCHDVLQEFGYMTLRPKRQRN